MSNSEAPSGVFNEKGLGVLDVTTASGRVPDMTDCPRPRELSDHLTGKDLRYEAHAAVVMKGLPF
jgi:hypothetical protein